MSQLSTLRAHPARQLVLLVAFATLLAALAGLPWNPRRVELGRRHADETAAKLKALSLRTATLAEVDAFVAGGTRILLDARKLETYQQGHIPTAMPLPFHDFQASFANLAGLLVSFQDPLLVYCGGRECDESIEVARLLRDMGYTDVVVYPGGFEEWKAAGRAVE